jgi:deoxyribose-phosphate aldolase
MAPHYEEISRMIDHSLLRPTLTTQEVVDGCHLADRYKVKTVCVRPSDVKLAHEILKNSPVLVTTVVGFPHGDVSTASKVFEAREAIEAGARELDIVQNFGRLKSGDHNYVRQDLAAVTEAAHEKRVPVKIIFENCYLSEEEIIAACLICNDLGVDFVKTSTGFGTGGAEDKDIRLMRQHCLPRIQIKAAGGIRTLERLLEVKTLGCTRVGATATAEILEESRKRSSK